MNRPEPAPLPAGEALLSRAASSRIGELEVLRTIAVTMVLLEHLSGNLMFWPSHLAKQIQQSGAWTGVDLFFAISGFVIARSLLPKLEEARDPRAFMRVSVEFWIRRAWRLWPSAWFWLAAPLVLCFVFNRTGVYGGFKGNWEMAVAGVTNLANFHFAAVFMRAPPGTAFVQWSLSLEEQFYILLPFAAFLLRRKLPYLMGAILLYAFFTPIPYTPLAMMIRGGSVAAGVLLAIWSFHPTYQDCAPVFLGRRLFARIGVLLGGIALLVTLGSAQWPVVPFFLGPVAIVTALLVWVGSYGEGYLWQPGWPRSIMEVLAARTYSLYLIHIPVYFVMHEAWFRLYGGRIPTPRQAVIYLLAAITALILVTELNHRLLERPLREHGKAVARRYAAKGQTPPCKA